MESVTILKADPRFLFLSWVIQARAEDQTRCHITGFLVENDNKDQLWIATDGRRLHTFRLEDGKDSLPVGNARIILANKDSIVFEPDCADMGQFPQWRRVIPTLTNAGKQYKNAEGPITLPSRSFSLKKSGTMELANTIRDIAKKTQRTFDPFFLLPLADSAWTLYGDTNDPENHALEFQSNGKTCVIMPIHSAED